jgi:hypothetical protein
MCAREVAAPSCSGFTIDQIDAIVGRPLTHRRDPDLSLRRTSANGRPDDILMCSTAIVCDVMNDCVVAWVMSRSHPLLR